MVVAWSRTRASRERVCIRQKAKQPRPGFERYFGPKTQSVASRSTAGRHATRFAETVSRAAALVGFFRMSEVTATARRRDRLRCSAFGTSRSKAP